MKKNSIKYKLVLYLCLLSMISFSQIDKNGSVSIIEPNAASFAKFIDNPVNNFNGSVAITIPVYTLINGQIEIPITLRYNTSGIKVSEEASMVGLGWNLNVGGVITHNVVGALDTPQEYNNLETIYPSMYSPGPSEHWFWQHQYLIPKVYPLDYFSYINSLPYTYSYIMIDEMVENAHNATYAEKGQPDIYYFTFLGYSGKFFIDYRDGSIHIMEKDQDIKFVNYEANDGQMYWKALTPDGTWFYFQLRTNTTSNCIDINSFSYHLTKVVFPNGRILNLEYESFGVASLGKQLISYYKQDVENYNPFNKKYFYNNTFNTIMYDVTLLSQIKFDNSNESIHFYYSPREDIPAQNNSCSDFNFGDRQLDSIVVSNNTHIHDKTFLFDYSYFISLDAGNVWDDGAAPMRKKRLKLLSFGEEGKPKYNFYYSDIELPSKLSYAQDYWGYYNGKTDNISLLPNFWSFYHLNDPPSAEILPWSIISKGGIRACDTNYVEAAALTKTEYPTGGYMDIDYESNSFTNYYYPSVEQIEEYHQIIDDQTVSIDRAAWEERYEDNTSVNTPYYFDIETTSKVIINFTFNWNTQNSNYLDINGAYVKVATRDPVYNYPLETIDIVYVHYQDYPPVQGHFEEITLEPGHYGIYTLLPPPNEPGKRLTVQADINIQPIEYIFPDGFGSISYGGGIRVKSIKQMDKDKLNLYTKYDYHDGKLMSPIELYTIHYQTTFEYFTDQYNVTDIFLKNYNYVNKTSSSNIQLSYDANGGLVGYPEVNVQRLSDIPTENYGYEKYSYFWALPLHSLTLPNIPSPLNGKIERHQIFNSKGNEIFRKEYEYELEELHRYYGFKPHWNRYWDDILRYSLISNRINLSSSTELYFDETGLPYGEKAFDYTYNSSNLLASVTENTSDNNKTLITNNIYVADIENPSQLYSDMIEMNRISPLISKTISRNENGSLADIYKIEYEYDYLPSIHFDNDIFFPTISSKITEYQTGDNSDVIVTDLNHDNWGNIIEISKQNNQIICHIWGYNYEFPVAKITNATFIEAGHTSFENNELNGWNKYQTNLFDQNVFFTGKASIAVTDGYGPGKEFNVGLQANNHSGYQASVWVKGSKNAYLHIEANSWSVHERISNIEETDGWHLLKVVLYKHQYESLIDSNLIIKVYVGNEGGDIAYFDDLRFYPLDAEMTTFTHEPLIGVTSVSDNNNKPTRYEYDAFGRLIHTIDFQNNILKKNEYHYKP